MVKILAPFESVKVHVSLKYKKQKFYHTRLNNYAKGIWKKI
jgi:hypothetical protein